MSTAHPQAVEFAAGSNPRILLVEDEPTVVQLFEEVLVERGYPFDAVEDVDQALAALAENRYDLVITDKNLPGKANGLDLLRAAKQSDGDLEIILITGYADMDSALEAIRGGVYDYITKPFDSVDDVFHRIEGALHKRHMRLENHRLVERLEAMNRELEAKVLERTRQLEELTITDELTGLHNQRFLYQRLPEEIARASRFGHPLAVLVLDVDHFKRANDSQDHLFGSRVLKRVGEILRRNTRAVDMVIRYGGDEFIVVMPETGLTDATRAAGRLREQAEATDVGDDDLPYRVTFSIGVGGFDGTGSMDTEALLKSADEALFKAKESGRNRVMVMPEKPVSTQQPSHGEGGAEDSHKAVEANDR